MDSYCSYGNFSTKHQPTEYFKSLYNWVILRDFKNVSFTWQVSTLIFF